ncbi:MAG TPA: SpoIIE family protein phosphatase [Nocardioidaceae bacterium]|nr:SpoIIE family protein phosphatase [Nocardioidaceae bacterium]
MSARRRVTCYVLALVIAAAAVTWLGFTVGQRPSTTYPWWTLAFFAPALVAASHLSVRFRHGDDVDLLTLHEAVLAPLLFAFGTLPVVCTVVVAQIGVSVLARRSVTKAVFNLAQLALAAAVGSLVFNSLALQGEPRLATIGWLIVALVCVGAVNNAAFTLVLAISGGRSVPAVLRELKPVIVPGWLGGWTVNVIAGLLFVLAYESEPAAVVLFPIVLIALHLAYRERAAAHADRQRFAGLRQAARTLSQPIRPLDAVDEFLVEVGDCFDAKAAALLLRSDGNVYNVYLRHAGRSSSFTVPADGLGLESVLAAQPQPVRAAISEPGAFAALLLAAGWRDCMCAPLVDEERRIGAVAVFDQTGIERDSVAELAVLEALARETAHTIARGLLFDEVMDERRKLDEIVSSTSDGIFTLSENGDVLTWNRGCEQITGLPAARVLGRRDVFRELDARTALGNRVDLARWAQAQSLPAEILITPPGSGDRRLSCSTSTASDGLTRTLVVVARDITPAERYQELQQQFGRLVEAQEAQRLVVDHLQQAVAPEPPSVEGAEIAVAYVASDPSSPTGGDLFDWRVLPSGELHVAVVDVVGHGVAATKDALTVIHTLRFAAVDGTPLEQMVTRADSLLSAQDSELVATAVIARFSPETGELRVVSGGHPPALVVRANGEVTQVRAAGGAIGWPGVGSDDVATVMLGINDALVLYTDGLIEARKNVLDGLEALMSHAGDIAALPAEQFVNELIARSLRGADRRDDSLALVVRRTRVREIPGRASWDILPGDLASMQAARHQLRDWLGSHRRRGDDVVLVAGELLANAVVWARSLVVLGVSLEADTVVIEVSDDGRGDSALDQRGLALPPNGSEKGWGLVLVRAVSQEVQTLSTDVGTVVRCVVPAPPVARTGGALAVPTL